jgi:hypothetical protein
MIYAAEKCQAILLAGALSPQRNVLYRDAGFLVATQTSLWRFKVLHGVETFRAAMEASPGRWKLPWRDGSFRGAMEPSMRRWKVPGADGTFYAAPEGSTAYRKVLRRIGTFYAVPEGSTPERNLLHRKVRFHCNREAYRPVENGTEGRRRSFRLGSLGSTTGSGISGARTSRRRPQDAAGGDMNAPRHGSHPAVRLGARRVESFDHLFLAKNCQF